MNRHANALWNGDLKTGTGRVTVESQAFVDQPYSFKTRFEDGTGLNPEELIAASHASCFSMATSAQLGERGITNATIETTSVITMENLALTKSALTVKISAPGADEATVTEAANAAKEGCPISKVLNLEITLDLTVSV